MPLHLSSTTRIKSCAAAAADFQHPLEQFKVENRNEAACGGGGGAVGEETGRTSLQIVKYFQEPTL